jgi:hypothetical protein
MNTRKINIASLVSIIVLPLVFATIPTTFFENTPSICLWKNLFGFECPGCGMTRAFSAVIHFQFAKAFGFNKLVVIVFPLLLFVWFFSIVKYVKLLKKI